MLEVSIAYAAVWIADKVYFVGQKLLSKAEDWAFEAEKRAEARRD